MAQEDRRSGEQPQKKGGKKSNKRRYFRRRRRKGSGDSGQSSGSSGSSGSNEGSGKPPNAKESRSKSQNRRRSNNRRRNSRRRRRSRSENTQDQVLIQEQSEEQAPTDVYIYTHTTRPAYRESFSGEFVPDHSLKLSGSTVTSQPGMDYLLENIGQQLDEFFNPTPKPPVEIDTTEYQMDDEDLAADGVDSSDHHK